MPKKSLNNPTKDRVIERAILLLTFIFIIFCAITVPTYPKNQVSNVTPTALYNHLREYLGKRRDKEWAKYQGKIVHWTGSPMVFGTRGITDQGFLIDLAAKGDTGYLYIRVYFPETEAKMLPSVSRYDSIMFEGKLARYSLSFPSDYNFLIKDAKVVKVIKARSLISIIDHEFLVFKSLYTGHYEFKEFHVILRNEGKRPLKGRTLEVDFGDIMGIKRNVRVGPQEDREIRMWWYDGEWIVNGEKKNLSFNIPPGYYIGTIRLRDKKGRRIASRPLSHYLPPFERKYFPWEKEK